MSEKIDQHKMVAELKNLAIELGRTPTYDEFKNTCRHGSSTIQKYFGSYATLVQAADLEPIRKPKTAKEAWTVDLERHLESHTEIKKKIKKLPFPTAAIISDIHWPFENQEVIDAFYNYVEKEKPEFVIINGDAWDMYSHSKFPRSHNVFTPRQEQEMSRKKNEEFWKKILSIHPKATCYQLLGNHDIRPLKRVMEEYPEAEDWIKEKMQELFTFKKVTTIHDVRQELYLNDQTIVFHGYKTKLGDHRDFTLLNTINGHSHVGGTVCRRIHGITLTETNSGYAGNPETKGLTYTPQKITNWTPGFAAIDKYGMRFIAV